MFTGIVLEMGEIRRRTVAEHGATLTIGARETMARLRLGESVAVNGVCLTVVALSLEDSTFTVQAVPQTLRLTTLGTLQEGDSVNLEPPLRAGDPMGGHWVMGHVDGVAQVVASREDGNSRWVTFRPPAALMRYIVEKGSIAVDGVSLTVAGVEEDRFHVALIPHTCAVTTLGRLSPGMQVNVEVDVLGKYVEKLVSHYVGSLQSQGQGLVASSPASRAPAGAEEKEGQ